jgi:hypothetical protein
MRAISTAIPTESAPPDQNSSTDSPSTFVLAEYWDYHSDKYDEPPPRAELPAPDGPLADRLWHYTSVQALPGCLRGQQIDVFPEDDVPRIAWVAWFSSLHTFERTCVAALHCLADGDMDSIGSEVDDAFGEPGAVTEAIRIEVSPSDAPYIWAQYWSWAGFMNFRFFGFAESMDAIEPGLPSCWFVSPYPVPARRWIAVEFWDPDRLCWLPIQESGDRMLQDMLPLLPEHLRRSERVDGGENQPTITSTSRYHPLNLVGPSFGLSRADRPPVPDPLHWDCENHVAEAIKVRRSWLDADRLARNGVAVVPLVKHGTDLHVAHSSPTQDSDAIDRLWLHECPAAPHGIALGVQSGGLFAIKLSGSYRSRWILSGARPATLTFLAWADYDVATDTDIGELPKPRYHLAIFRAPEGVRVHPGTIAKSEHGQVEVITTGIVPGPGGTLDGLTMVHRHGALLPIAAPQSLIDRIGRGPK